jgi:hypothetical protein
MAIESLGGGLADQLAQLPIDAVQLLEEVLKDTVGGIASVSHPAPEITTINSLGQGQPGAGDVIQTAFLATEPASNVPMSKGSVTLMVSVPDNTVVTMEGPGKPISPADANTYLQALLDEAIPASRPNPVAQAERQHLEEMINLITPTTGTAQQRLETAIDQAQQSLVKASEAIMPTAEEHVQVMQIKLPQDATEPVKLDVSGTPRDVVNVPVAQTGAKVEVVDAKAVDFVGTGEVTVGTAQQRLETAIDQAQQSLVKASEAIMPTAEEHVQVMQFGDAASITLVGVSASQVTADMIHFNP